MRNLILIWGCIFFLLNPSSAQQILTTTSGQKILLHDDESWESVSRDAVMDQHGKISISKTTDINVFEIPQEEDISMTKTQSRDIRNYISDLEYQEAKCLVFLTSENLKILNLQERSELNKADTLLAKLIVNKRTELNDASKKYVLAGEHIATLKEYKVKKTKHLGKKLISIQKSLEKEFNIKTKKNSQIAAQKRVDKKTLYPTSFKLIKDKDVNYGYECDIVFDGKDAVTGKNKKEVKEGLLFTYTQDKLKPYFKEDDFMHCNSLLTKVGGNYYLTLKIRMKSKSANRNYGQLSANAEMKVEFIDGTQIIGTNILQDNGSIEAYSGHTLYTGVYVISKDDLNDLGDNLIDNIGIFWSTGYEQYDIYNIDFLIHQVKCLKKG